MNSKMRELGRALNLKPHALRRAGTVAAAANESSASSSSSAASTSLSSSLSSSSSSVVELCGPFDLEGHRGTDGRLYLLDFARLCPPEPPPVSSSSASSATAAAAAGAPTNPASASTISISTSTSTSTSTANSRAYLHRSLRPEFVRAYRRPLSPDAFCPLEVDGDAARAELREAYAHLLAAVIPRFAREMIAPLSSTSSTSALVRSAASRGNGGGGFYVRSNSTSGSGNASGAATSFSAIEQPRTAADMSAFIAHLHSSGINVRCVCRLFAGLGRRVND
jgi:hypothetical protein